MSSPQARLDLAAQIGLLTFLQPTKSPSSSAAISTSAASPALTSAEHAVPIAQLVPGPEPSSSFSPFLTSGPSAAPNSSLASNSSSPSLVMKAYALALKSRMIVDADLSLTKQAVFVANVQNKGIPLDVAPAYANEALYHHANAIQDGSQITFQSSKGDFFEYMNGYMLQVQDDELDDETSTPEIRAYTDLLKLTEKAYQRLLADYKGIKATDPDYKWQDHVAGPEGAEYRRYWAKRDEASAKLPDSAVVMALKIFDSSHARAESKKSQNMPCVLGDVNLGSDSRFVVDPKDIIYRPAYGLPGFVSAASYWRNSYMQTIGKPQELVLDLEAAADTPWKSLGFPNFVDTKISKETLTRLQNYRVSLTFTGMMPLRITRGLWNIEDFRDFTTLQPDAPAKFKSPTFRTDMLLMAYGAQMRIEIPDATDKPPQILPELLSGVNLNKQGNGVWLSDTPNNDAYPILLAALASKR